MVTSDQKPDLYMQLHTMQNTLGDKSLRWVSLLNGFVHTSSKSCNYDSYYYNDYHKNSC